MPVKLVVLCGQLLLYRNVEDLDPLIAELEQQLTTACGEYVDVIKKPVIQVSIAYTIMMTCM